jgi:flagellin-like protein
MFKQKKGVSPLIATVLLIAFAVALGAVVMNWGRTYVEDTASLAREKSDTEIKCSSDVKLEFLKIKNVKKLCYEYTTTTKLNMTIENTGKLDVVGLQITVVGAKNINTTELDLKAYNLTLKRSRFYRNETIEFNDLGVPQQVRIVPEIEVEGNRISCPSTALTEETFLKKCSEI